MLELQILFLTLIPVFSGIVPHDGLSVVSPSALFGIAEPVTEEFIRGAWQTSDEFFKWGITDREKATLRPFRKSGFVKFNNDGTVQMINFFQPAEGRWQITEKGLILKDPRYAEASERLLPVRKRDDDRMWLLLPFSGGAIGIGLVRVPEKDVASLETQAKTRGNRTDRKPIRNTIAPRRIDLTGPQDEQMSSQEVAPKPGQESIERIPW